jgi:ribosomal protein L11 methyltransferase
VTWFAIEVRPEPGQRDAVAAWLVSRTGQAVEERADGTLVSFALDLAGAVGLEEALARAHGPVATTRRELPEVDWSTAWRAGLAVRQVGRFAVVPTWIHHQPAPGELVITLDPEMAFGSGEHGSTRGALQLLQQHLRQGDRVLDLGSGSAILSIAAAMLGAARVAGIELDAEAIPASLQNVERNGVAGVVRILEGDAAAMTPLLAPVDLIVSNILRLVNQTLLPVIHGALVPGGRALFSGMEQSEAELFRAPLRAQGFTLLDEVVDENWWSVAVRRG